MTRGMVDYLNQKAVPLQEYKIIELDGTTATFKHTLSPHEVRFYELRPLRHLWG